MKIFVTGATGFVGSAIVDELRNRGHDIVGLARSESSANALSDAGLNVHRGNIADPESVTSALSQVDAVIHTAFNHDFSRYLENCEADGRLLDALARALEGTDKALIATSVTIVTPSGELSTENDRALDQVPRSASEAFLDYANRGVQTSVVRLPPSVHGAGDTAFVPALIALARKRGVSAYVDDGANRWPAVHRDDAARLFCDAVERPRPAARYHAVAETGLPFREIAEAIGDGLGVPAESVPNDWAEVHFGWLAMFAAIDNPVSNDWTREATGWASREVGLISDMRNAGYFSTPSD
ncbi:SDR family oxidoreductase [Algihabitans albus]|uniref:SDR family oxidoreductase n=1 Tax=Algihabitans albus TaxID=2164067 RepID=UPI000E5CE769|nr:SDR family oxidoreductase [Algihabitans albus]